MDDNRMAGSEATDVQYEAPIKETGFRRFMSGFKSFWKWVFRLRSVGLAIPVAVLAIMLAIYNEATLPDRVGIDLQATGEYAEMISKETAVFGPLALTGVCLLLMFCSRKVLYPWLISIFSLILPILILITNIFPS